MIFRFIIYLFILGFIFHIYFKFFNTNNIYVVVTSCSKNNKSNLNISLIPYDVIILKCNKTTNNKDSREAGLMLDFIIEHYKERRRYKYIFVHDHAKSWHHTTDLYSRLKYLKDIKYIDTTAFSGIYCVYIVFGKNRPYDKNFNRTYEIDKYMRNKGYTNLSLYQLYTKKYLFPCCATFVVDSIRIKKHLQSFYINLRKGIKKYVENGGSNDLSAVYMEFMWSIIFGIENIPIPPDCNSSTF